MQVQEKTSITLSTLDVQLADNLLGDFSFDGNLVGEYFDEFIQSESRKETKLSLKVFEYQGKLYSEELVRLWFYNQNTGFQRTFHYQEKFFQDMSILFLLSVVILWNLRSGFVVKSGKSLLHSTAYPQKRESAWYPRISCIWDILFWVLIMDSQ